MIKIIFTILLLVMSVKSNSVIIIGAGPTACAAATYLARSHIPVTMISGESHQSQMIWADKVENYPGMLEANGADLLENMRNQAKEAGTKIIYNDVVAVDFSQNPFCLKLDNGKIICAKAVLIATGSQPKELKVPGEQEYRGKGIGICATCDGPLCENKEVVLVGGKFDMLRELPIIAKYTNKITIINKDKNFEAPSYFKRSFKRKNGSLKPKVLNNTSVQEIFGDDERATGLKIYNNKTRKSSTLKSDCIFITVGRVPSSDIFEKYLKTNLKGHIIVDCDGKTNIPGVFAAGDVTDRTKYQIVTNSGEGYRAAMAIDEYMQSISQFDQMKDISPAIVYQTEKIKKITK